MDILISAQELDRKRTTRVAKDVLEAAIEQVLGYPVQIRGIEVWASPMMFDDGRVPERWLHLPAAPEHLQIAGQGLDVSALLGQAPLPLQPQRLMPVRKDVSEIPTAAEMVRRRRARLRREREQAAE